MSVKIEYRLIQQRKQLHVFVGTIEVPRKYNLQKAAEAVLKELTSKGQTIPIQSDDFIQLNSICFFLITLFGPTYVEDQVAFKILNRHKQEYIHHEQE